MTTHTQSCSFMRDWLCVCERSVSRLKHWETPKNSECRPLTASRLVLYTALWRQAELCFILTGWLTRETKEMVSWWSVDRLYLPETKLMILNVASVTPLSVSHCDSECVCLMTLTPDELSHSGESVGRTQYKSTITLQVTVMEIFAQAAHTAVTEIRAAEF